MIRGNGVDIVDLKRFQKMEQHRLDRLAKRILTTVEHDDFLKVVVVGPEGVGKTQIVNQFMKKQYNEEYNTTIAIDFFSKS
jgi:GTPase SAR1 family protein